MPAYFEVEMGFAESPMSEVLESSGEALAPEENHFAPIALEAESLLNRFFERLEGYEAEALTEAEIERVIAEIAPPHDPFAPASEQFLGGLVRSVGRFVSKTVKSAAHAVADVSSSVADTLGKVPVLGSGLKGLYGYTYGALIQAADNVVSGVRLDKVASRYFESQVRNVRELAPYVQAVISLVPGIGPGVSGAISAGLSLAQGRSIDEALVDAAVGALPGGALVQSAAKMTFAAASGKPISDIAVAALPLSPAAKEGLKAGLRVASDLAQGKRVDKTLLAEANRQIDRLPPQLRTAAQVGIALGQGKKLQEIASSQLPRLIAMGGPLAAAGQKVASQSPIVQRARTLLAKEGQHGFDVAQGLMAHTGANVHQLERARAAFRGDALKGFERAVALHGGYVLHTGRGLLPSRPVRSVQATSPARIRSLGRPVTAIARGVKPAGPIAPTPTIRRPEVLTAVQHLPADSALDEPAAVASDDPPPEPISGVSTSNGATCPSCGAPQPVQAADSEPDDGSANSSGAVDDSSVASEPAVGELEGSLEFGELARPSSSRSAPIAGGPSSAATSRARYAKWSDADDRRKGRNPREQSIAAAGPEGASKVLEFPLPDGVSQRLFLLHNFKVDGAALRPEHKQYLEGLAQWMRSRPRSDWQIFVEAHASRTGTKQHDDVLSEDRYLVTRAFLESQLLAAGIDAARLRIYGEGVGFRHSLLPGEDPRARSVYVVVQPNPSPFPPTVWPPPITPVPWPPARPRPLPVPPPPVTVTDIFDYVPIDFVLEDLKLTLPSVFSKRPAFRDLASLTATPAGAMIGALKGGPHKDGPIKVDPADATKFQTRVRMQLAFPASTANPARPAGSGKLPLAVLVHGHHDHYAVTSGGVLREMESFRGYRYLQAELARAGIASISVDTNMANATGSLIELRADLVLEALKLLKRRTSVSGTVLSDRFNFDRVALMGHSRGGDAVVRVVKKNRAAPAASRFGILTVCSLAPTDLTGGQVPANRMFLDQYDLNFYSVLYGALDGDVSGKGGSNSPEGGTGFRHYDRARCQKALVFAERCCHNSFNSVWHADGLESGVRSVDRDRLKGGKLVDETTHQNLAIEYIGTQFKDVLKGTASKTSLFNGTTPSATGLATAILWAFGNPMWTIDDFENPTSNLARGGRRLNSGAVLSDFGSIEIPAKKSINDHVLEQGHVVHADTAVARGSPSGVETTLPVGSRDLSLSTTFALDVGAFFDTATEATINAGTPPTFSVILHDNKGAKATAAGSSFSPGLRKPFFHELSSGKNVTALHLETLKIPLTAFTGIDLRNVVKIQVEVSPPSGHLFIDDIKVAGF